MSVHSSLDATVTTQSDSAPATLPSAFLADVSLDDMREDTGWDASNLFGDEAPVPRFDHPEDLDPDDIPTVKIVPELAGEEPDAELLARAERISCAPAPTHELTPTHEPAPEHEPTPTQEPDERISFTFVRDPVPAPDFKARLVEIHRRAGFRINFRLPSIGPVSIGLLLAMVVPSMQARPLANPPGFPTDACTFPDQPCFEAWQTPAPLDVPDFRQNTIPSEVTPAQHHLQVWWIVEQIHMQSGRA